MSWSYIRTWGNVSSKSSSNTLSLYGPETQASVGDVLVITISLDNVQTTDGSTSLVSSVTDSASNSYFKVAEYTNGEGAAGAGVVCSVWYGKITNAHSGGAETDEIVMNLASSVTAKVAVVHQFRPTGGSISVLGAAGRSDDTDPSTMTISGLASREYLFIRAVASETENYGFTNSTDYTTLATDTTSGGAADTNVCIGAEYRIFTGTGDTTDPITFPTSASVFFAISDAASFSLTANKGTFNLTGNNANFSVGRRLTADRGTFTLTGHDASINKGYALVANSGTFTLTGNDVNFSTDRVLTADRGQFALTGNAANFLVGRRLEAASGTFTVTGRNANFVTANNARSRAATMYAFQQMHQKTQAEQRGIHAGMGGTTGPKKQAQNAAKRAEKRRKAAQRQAKLDALEHEEEMRSIEEDFLADMDIPDLEMPQVPAGLSMLTPENAFLARQMGYMAPADAEDEEEVELLLLYS